MKTCMVHDVEVKVGDNVAFKSDIEQWAKIIEIKKTYMGVALVLENKHGFQGEYICLLYTSPSPRDVEESRMPSSA